MRTIQEIASSLQPQKKVFIVGSAFLDMLMTLDKLPTSGADVIGSYEGLKVGGCSFNVADVLLKLHLPFESYLPIGEGDFAKIARNEFVQRGLPLHEVKGRGDNGWCLSLVESGGQRTFITMPGIETKMQATDFDCFDLKSFDYVYVSGYQLDGQNCKAMVDMLNRLSDECTIVFDPGPRIGAIKDDEVLAALAKHKLIYSINDEEAMLKTGCSCVEDAVACLYAQTKNIVCVTAGADGAYAADIDGSIMHIPGFKVDVVDTVGSGDSHSGGLIAGLMCGLPLAECVLLANKVASVVTSRSGAATAPSLEELLA